MKLASAIPLILFLILSKQLRAQDFEGCGELPIEPVIVHGATSTMDQLIANSEKVNAYIAEADIFLDCSEARYKKLGSSRIHKDRLAEQIKSVTTRRNEIGEEFNAQVAAFRVANPE